MDNNKWVKIVAGAVAGITVATAATFLVFDPKVVDNKNDLVFCYESVPQPICYSFTQDEYVYYKNVLATKINASTPLTYEEYQLFLKIGDYEVKQTAQKKIILQNVKKPSDITSKFNSQIKDKQFK